MNKKIFNTERMLQIADFKFRVFSGINADIYVCHECLPFISTEGFEFQIQCGEDDLLTGGVFVANEYGLNGEFVPTVYENTHCQHCEVEGVNCWRLKIYLEALEYVSSRDSAQRRDFDWFKNPRVEILGRTGQIIQQTGYSELRPWIATYTIKFPDGTKLDAKRWQFKVVKS